MSCISKNTRDWLCGKVSIDTGANADAIKHIGDFAFLWNIFEGDYYQSFGLAGRNGDSFYQKVFDWSKEYFGSFGQSASDAFQYFNNRYVLEPAKLEGLGFKNSSINEDEEKSEKVIEIVRSILQSDTADVGKKLFALLAIAYRFRNQWFHGNKKLVEAIAQKESFEKINNFLMELMDNLSR